MEGKPNREQAAEKEVYQKKGGQIHSPALGVKGKF